MAINYKAVKAGNNINAPNAICNNNIHDNPLEERVLAEAILFW